MVSPVVAWLSTTCNLYKYGALCMYKHSFGDRPRDDTPKTTIWLHIYSHKQCAETMTTTQHLLCIVLYYYEIDHARHGFFLHWQWVGVKVASRRDCRRAIEKIVTRTTWSCVSICGKRICLLDHGKCDNILIVFPNSFTWR